MSVQPSRKYTPDEYIALESESEIKSEYFNGEIFAMGRASERHDLMRTLILFQET